MTEVLLEAFVDSLRIVPFLFLTYLVMGILEHAASDKPKKFIKNAGKFGPVWGSLLGAFPQCGFSAAASYFYIGRVLTLGTLISIYMSTSDEMLPIMLSAHVPVSTLLKLMGTKVAIGMITGFLVELLFGWMARKHKTPRDFVHDRECDSCSCGAGIAAGALLHTLRVFAFVFLVSLAIGTAIHFIGEEGLTQFFSDIPVLGEAAAGIVGLIPNCAASVVITQLYLDGIIGAGPMMSGLLVSAGVGLLVLFRENRHMYENITIAALLYAVSVGWGVVIEILGITF